MEKDKKRANTRRLLDMFKEHIAAVLGDIYQVGDYSIDRHFTKGKWNLTFEYKHKEFDTAMVIFSFVLTERQINDSLRRNSITEVIRTGRMECDR